ncbi:MAG: SusC/RagA family TonB-linked outer membrane protein [bacterium]
MKHLRRECFLVALVLLFGVTQTRSQELTISGTVTAQESGDFLPGANVAVKGTSFGTTSDVNGDFRLKLTGMSSATLVVSFIGYKTKELQVPAGGGALNIALEEDVLKLSEVVVTGVATSVARRNLANAVATVSANELVAAPAQTLDRALTAKFAGVNVSQNTGAPGGGINVDLRGTSTIEGTTQPLYVVDGVIINNAANQSGIDLVTAATGAGSPNPQGQPTNRVADINPNEIENIEVLKGSSAAAIYGSKASNGVVIITTKQGTPGKTKIDVNQQLGFNTLLRKIGSRNFAGATDSTINRHFGQAGVDAFHASGGLNVDYEDVMYGEEGFLTETNLSARGGSDRTQFYLSGLLRDEDGIIAGSGYQKYGGRVNLNHRFSDRVKADAFLNYTRSESDRGITGNDNTNTTFGFSLGFTPHFYDIRPQSGVYPVHPFNPSNPVQTRDLLINNELVNRTLGSLRLSWNLLRGQKQSLDFIVQTGVDFYSQENKIVSPPELQYEAGRDLAGASLFGTTESTNSNLYLNLAHNFTAGNNTIFQTSAGYQFENQNLNNVLNEARGLITTQTNVDQAATVNTFQNRLIERLRGFYAQEEINLQEKIFLTAGFRGDASSSNGDTKKYYLYPKASASVRLTQYGVFNSFANEFKLRAAYGETGNLPPADAKFTSLIPANAGGQAGLIPAARRGNAEIQPERTRELEAGLDASFASETVSLNFTYFRQNISELLLSPTLPPSSGFTEEIINGGKMRTQGVEISLGLVPMRRRNMHWNARINFYKTDSKITELEVDPFNIGGFATFLGTFRIEEGLSPTTIIGAEVDSVGADAQGNPIFRNRPLGNETPDFQFSFSNNLNYGPVEFGFLLDWKQGGDVINLGKFIYDLGGNSKDYDELATFNIGDTTVMVPKGFGRSTVAGNETAQYIEDGTYVKLREVTLAYTFPRTSVNSLFNGQVSYLKVGVSGRNLLMFTDYDGYDPEVSQFGNVSIGRSVDTIPYPSSRSFYFNVAFGL